MNNKYFTIIILICWITFGYGIKHTQSILANDITTQQWEWGRVDLICSYWYELYNPSQTISWYKKTINKPILYVSGDKAATPNYLNHFNMKLGRNTPYIWCIYPSNIRLNGYKITRLNPNLSWQNIYMVVPNEPN